MSEGASVDLGAVLEQVTRQRNAALDEVAKLLAYVDHLHAEIERLEAGQSGPPVVQGTVG